MTPLVLAVLLAAAPAPAPQGPLKWIGCDICKASFMNEAVVAFEKKSGVKIELEEMGDTKGILGLAAGKGHMGGTCRHTRNVPEERGVKQVPVGWDALVITVHPSNAVSSVTLDQVRAVFTGKVKSWKELGGKDLPVVPIERKGKESGVGLSARELIFKDPGLEYAPAAKLLASTKPVEEACEKEPGCMAITGISSARLRPGLKILAVDGKQPSHDNLVSGAYVLYRPLYLTYPAGEPDPRVAAFVKFMLSPEGQALVSKTGTVNLKEGKDLWAKYKAGLGGK